MHLRTANGTDLAALVRLENECLADEPWSAGALQAQLDDPGCLTLLAETDGTVAAYVSGRLLPPEAEIYRVATLPACRRRGLGQALLAAFLGRAHARGCRSFFLEVRASNAPAVSLYASVGFEKCGVRRAYYRNPREDALLFHLIREESPLC